MTTPSETPHIDRKALLKRLVFRRLKIMGTTLLLILVLGGGTYWLAPQWLLNGYVWYQAKLAGLSTEHVQVGDTDWAYYEGGKGPTLVLLHGYGSNRNVWLKVAKPLTRNFRLIIPDLPGWGDSSRNPDDDYGIAAQAARLTAFLGKLGIRHPVLVGHSMGGAIAGYAASSHPDDVAALVLVDSFGLTYKENDFARAALAGHNPFVFDDRAGYDHMMKLIFDQPPSLPGRFIDVLIDDNKANRAFLDKVFHKLSQPGQFDILDDRLDKLTMPVLAIWCSNDRIVDPSALDTLRNGLTNSPSINVTMINDCGHSPEIEKADAFVRILSGFAIMH